MNQGDYGRICCFLTEWDDGNSDKKTKGRKKCVIKQRLKFNDYKNFLLNNEITLKPQLKFKSKHIKYILQKLTRLH